MPTISKKSTKPVSDINAPVYHRIEQDLRRKIESDEWPAGMMLPGRQRLSEEYDVHHRTIDRAIRALVGDGILETQGTRGTFVAQHVRRPAVKPETASARFASADQPSWDSLRLTSAKRLGIFSTDTDIGDYSRTIIEQVEKAFSGAGGSAVFAQRVTRDAVYDINTVFDSLLAKGCDAIVIVCFNVEITLEQTYALVAESSVPMIFASAGSVNRPIWNVYYDNVDAGYQAATHLIDRGCDDLLFVGQDGHPWVDERIQGVRSAMRQRGLPDDAMSMETSPYRMHFVPAGQKAALAGLIKHVPKGVIAANDHIAEGIYLAADELGLVPGRDFLLVSFDDIAEARTLGVSSLRPPLEELGKGAARLAVHALNGDTTLQRTCLSSHLIVRDSSADPFRAR